MKVIYFRTRQGKQPVQEYILSLTERDQVAAYEVIDSITEKGFNAEGVVFRKIKDKLWEFYVEGDVSHRIFYVTIKGPTMVLVHAYKKESQKAPPKEVKLALKRMKEIVAYE